MSEIPAKVWFDRNTGRLQVTVTADFELANRHWLDLRHVNFRAERPDGTWMETAISASRNPAKRTRIRHAAGPDAVAPMPWTELDSIRGRALRGSPYDGWGHATVLQLVGEIDRLAGLEQLRQADELTRLDEPLVQADAAAEQAGPDDDDGEEGDFIDFLGVEDACTTLEDRGDGFLADAVRSLDRGYAAAQAEATRLRRELQESTATLVELAPSSLGTRLDRAFRLLEALTDERPCRLNDGVCQSHDTSEAGLGQCPNVLARQLLRDAGRIREA